MASFFRDLQAAGRSMATVRSYGLDLLRWFRFLWAIGVPWERATRVEARDFSRWLLVAGKPIRSHWRSTDAAAPTSSGVPYAASVRAHSETVLRCFYDFHLATASGPVLINPFPLVRTRREGRALRRVPCAGCGQAKRVKTLDRDGRPRCAQCTDVDDRDLITVIHTVVTGLDPTVGYDTIADAVGRSCKQRAYQQKLA
ncbi:site-specific integrase [Actinomadura sp. 3N407]|uniref:site-specific integrase n=1 Tax=Actinomadura sp. 3N407 TaxID=3457423 RepID=UPI003FCC31C4